MTTIIKIVLALVLVTAAARAGMAALAHYQFTDAVHEAMLFAPNASDAQLLQGVLKLAREHEVPITEDDVTLRHRGADIVVEFSYTKNITLIPNVYTRAWTFSPSVSVRSLRLPPPTP
jgi:hypothetical protein